MFWVGDVQKDYEEKHRPIKNNWAAAFCHCWMLITKQCEIMYAPF